MGNMPLFFSSTVPAAEKFRAAAVFLGVRTLFAAVLLFALSNTPTANTAQTTIL